MAPTIVDTTVPRWSLGWCGALSGEVFDAAGRGKRRDLQSDPRAAVRGGRAARAESETNAGAPAVVQVGVWAGRGEGSFWPR
jgi:hypothetical protein